MIEKIIDPSAPPEDCAALLAMTIIAFVVILPG
jgi:hypothetical protein